MAFGWFSKPSGPAEPIEILPMKVHVHSRADGHADARLPLETMEHILSYLSHDMETLKDCTYICKALVPTVRRYFWSTFVMRDISSYDGLKRAINNVPTISDEIVNCVHKVVFHSWCIYLRGPKEYAMLAALFSRFKHVETVSFAGPKGMIQDFNVLASYTTVFPAVKSLRIDSALHNHADFLSDVPAVWCAPGSSAPVNITHLKLDIVLETYTNHNWTGDPLHIPKCVEVVQALGPRLESLEIRLKEDEYLDRRWISSLQFALLFNFSKCPKLKRISLGSVLSIWAGVPATQTLPVDMARVLANLQSASVTEIQLGIDVVGILPTAHYSAPLHADWSALDRAFNTKAGLPALKKVKIELLFHAATPINQLDCLDALIHDEFPLCSMHGMLSIGYRVDKVNNALVREGHLKRGNYTVTVKRRYFYKAYDI